MFAGLSLTLAGCGEGFVAGKIESRVERRLPEIIGPADSYKVDVSGRTAAMISGKLSKMIICGKGVTLQRDLKVDDLIVEMRGVRFDTETNELVSVEETTFEAVLSQKSLTRLIAKKRPELKELKVELRDSKATVSTRPSVLGLSAGLSLTGVLHLEPKNKVSFIPDRISVAGLPAPGFAVDYVSERINPIMDLSLAKFPAEITELTVSTGRLTVCGKADLNRGLGAGKGVE